MWVTEQARASPALLTFTPDSLFPATSSEEWPELGNHFPGGVFLLWVAPASSFLFLPALDSQEIPVSQRPLFPVL